MGAMLLGDRLTYKGRIDMAQILQGLSYKVYFTTSSKFFQFGIFILVFGISAIKHQQLVAMLQEHMRFVYKKANMITSTMKYYLI